MEKREATILVVDDEKVNRMLLRSHLEKRYQNVLEAVDGMEAVKAVKENDVNLVLLDLMMPNMNGYDVLKVIRGHPKYQAIPVVVVTALSDVKDNAKAIELGADGFLTKPFNRVILTAMVENLLKQDSMQRKLIEAEKNEMFLATVVTANHEINQPLTNIMCSANLLAQSYEGDRIMNPEKFRAYIDSISAAAGDIAKTLKKLRKIKAPNVKTYIDSIKMVDINKVEGVADEAAVETKRSKCILIVDEESDCPDLLEEFLIKKGLSVKSIPSCDEAKEAFKKAPDYFDIILIDIKEPDKEGLKLFKELKGIKSDVNVILSSAYNLKDDVLDSIRKGAKVFLPKPYDTNNLMFFIEKILNKREPNAPQG